MIQQDAEPLWSHEHGASQARMACRLRRWGLREAAEALVGKPIGSDVAPDIIDLCDWLAGVADPTDLETLWLAECWGWPVKWFGWTINEDVDKLRIDFHERVYPWDEP